MSKGQDNLVKDLRLLLKEAEAGEFGDFTNKKYPAPKMALVNYLERIIRRVKQGRYDD